MTRLGTGRRRGTLRLPATRRPVSVRTHRRVLVPESLLSHSWMTNGRWSCCAIHRTAASAASYGVSSPVR